MTLLFSDVQGSTRLLLQCGVETYAEILAGQREIQREVWRRYDGVELGTEGDSFYVAFSDARRAVRAAADAQRVLSRHPWPSGVEVRVRMGLHTGVPAVFGDVYVGLDVHRAARIAATAHGGQVLISGATAREIAGQDGLADESLVGSRSLGRFLLRDLPQPEELFQLQAEGLPEEFPTVLGVGSVSTLPRAAGTLWGRDAELDALTQLLAQRDLRVVTLSGVGGAGKTRLAVEAARRVAARYADGVYFVPLEHAATAEQAWQAMADAMDLPPGYAEPPAIFDAIGAREVLLILDNVEQISGIDGVLGDLVRATTGPRALVTSRFKTAVGEGEVLEISPLPLPREGQDPRASPSVQLFMERAAPDAAAPNGPTTDLWQQVAAICRTLDGLPLAIELTAARFASAPSSEGRVDLGSLPDISVGDSARSVRHRSLRQAMRWSYELLDDTQQRVVRTMGALPGGARAATAAAVVRRAGCTSTDGEAVSVLRSLARAAMVSLPDGQAGDRVSMLNTLSAFALEELRARGEEASARLAVFEELLAMADPPGPASADLRRQLPELLQDELPNLRVLMPWLTEHTDGERLTTEEVDRRLGLATALSVQLGTIGGHFAEPYGWAQALLSRTTAGSAEARANLMLRSCDLARNLGRHEEARRLAEDAAALVLGGEGDRDDACSPVGCLARLGLGVMAADDGDLAGAARHWHHDLRSDAESYGHHWCLLNLAYVTGTQGHFDRAVELTQRGLAMAARIGDGLALAGARLNEAGFHRQAGRPAAALAAFRDARTDLVGLRNPEWQAACIEDLACVLADLGRHRDSGLLFRRAELIRAPYSSSRHPSQESLIGESRDRTHRALGAQLEEVAALAATLDLEQTLAVVFDDSADR